VVQDDATADNDNDTDDFEMVDSNSEIEDEAKPFQATGKYMQ
jgi:hypothetical protein